MHMDILYENFVYFTDTDIFLVFVCDEVVDRDLRCYHVFSAMNSQKVVSLSVLPGHLRRGFGF